MTHVAVVVPGPVERTGGYIYDRRVIEGLRQLGWSVDLVVLSGSYPFPDDSARAVAAGTFATFPEGRTVIVDGLAFGALPDLVEAHARRLRLVALVHLPLSADVTRDSVTRARLACGEERALTAAALVIVTSDATVPMLAGYNLPPDKILVVEPGTDRSAVARGSARRASDDGPIALLCVATLNPGKGHGLLLAALARLRDRPWHLTCAGSLTRDPDTAARVQNLIAELELTDRVSLVGDLDEAALAAAYDRSDLFVLATLQETYGMAVAEAIARGLPVVSTITGAIPRIVGDAGLLVPAGDVEALTAALSRLMQHDHRARCAVAASRMRDALPTWDQACARIAVALTGADTDG